MKLKSYLAVLSMFSSIALAVEPTPAEVLVTWGENQKITRQDYEAALQNIPGEHRLEFQTDMKRITSLLETVMVQRALSQEAVAAGLDKDPLTQKEIAQAAERVLAKKHLELFEKTLKKPNFEPVALERYKTKPDQFQTPEQIRASHVLIDSKCRDEETARKRAEEVRQKALKGADFAELAREYSDDPSAQKNNGDLGLFGRGQMVKPFEDAAFALKNPGDISEPVKSRFGYHVIKLHERLSGKIKPFAEVKQQLVKEAEEKFVSEERAVHTSKIRNDKSIVIHTEAVDRLLKK